MLSQKLCRVTAGLGIFAIGGLGLLAPTTAVAEDSHVITDASAVTISETLISNQTIIDGYGGGLSILLRVTPTACAEIDCVGVEDIPDVTPTGAINFYAMGNQTVHSDPFLPDESVYTKDGVYSWVVTHGGISMLGGQYAPRVAFSGAQYTIRATVKKSGADYVYDRITITKDKNDDGTPNGNGADSLAFVNVAEDLGVLEVDKTVVNELDMTEVGPYDMEVTFKWPENFNGAVNSQTGKWTTTLPEVIFADDSEATNAACVRGTTAKSTTTCTFTLDKDKKAKFANIPVGSTYTVTETSTHNTYTASYTNQSGEVPLRQWTGMPIPIPPIANELECVAHNNPPSFIAVWNAETNLCDITVNNVLGPDPVVAVVTNVYKNVTPPNPTGTPTPTSTPSVKPSPTTPGPTSSPTPSGDPTSPTPSSTPSDDPSPTSTPTSPSPSGTPSADPTVPAPADTCAADDPAKQEKVYRLYNPGNSEHLFTTDAVEYEVLADKHGWKQEGVAWVGPNAKGSSVGVYRLYNAGLGDHHYTKDQKEAQKLVSEFGWVYDNNGQPLFYSEDNDKCARINVYRQYNGGLKTGQHHYTADKTEWDTLAAKHGWQKEGIGWYALSWPNPKG